MNRYLSSERWRKVEAGCYESPDAAWIATRVHMPSGAVKWELTHAASRKWGGTYLTLADCQEYTDRYSDRFAKRT